MDKGIFYLICSVAIMTALATGIINLSKQISKECTGKVETVSVIRIVTPTATPSAALRRVLVK